MKTFIYATVVALLIVANHAPASGSSEVLARKGPPWISIEHPVNPYDATTRDAFLVVHAFHHGTPTSFPVSGTAEGIVDGQRRTVSLEFTPTSRPGVFALKKQWGTGVWTLVIAVTQAVNDQAQAVVDIAPNGSVASVRVPTKRQGSMVVPDRVSMAEVDAGLRKRAN